MSHVTGWGTSDIPDQTGRTAVVTGANSGLGLVTARELARAGATVVMACRNPERGQAARADVTAAAPKTEVVLERLDLADLSSVRELAAKLSAERPRIDLLINNAGVMAPPRSETVDGFELQLGTNHLGHFALTGRLLEPLLATPAARVVTVTSPMHRIGRIDFGDLQREHRYNRWLAYGQSKLANLLFARELQLRLTAAGADAASMAAHPGYAATHLQSSGPGAGGGLAARVRTGLLAVGNAVYAQSEEMGALPQLYAATAPEVPDGAFCGPSGFDQMRGHPTLVGSSGAGSDMNVAARLWDVSAELTGVDFAALDASSAPA
jgi:NAD(P)-dependent dehydrogenase (short-subunit alcohol dehydrogenase family)